MSSRGGLHHEGLIYSNISSDGGIISAREGKIAKAMMVKFK